MSVLATLSAAVAGRYEVERELGHGGMAEVYVARDLRVGRRVAIKALRPEMAQAVGPDRFLREIDIAARLQHPHILPLFDSAVANGLLYYVMPLVEGETLRERLRREVQLPIAETLHIARQVADALDYAHAHGVVHRDVKPENVLLSGDRTFVADFGVARLAEAAGGEWRSATGATTWRTETGIVVGTLGYMSPEQATATPQLDGRSDQYALACVIYEMLSGETPFQGASLQLMVSKLLTLPPPSVRVVRDTVPGLMDQALQRALSRTPADRFRTCREFVDALGARPTWWHRVADVASTRLARRAAVAVAVLAGGYFAWRVVAGTGDVVLDPSRIVVFPLAATDPDLNTEGVGWNVALAISSALEHAEPLRVVDGWSRLTDSLRADPRRVRSTTALEISRDRRAGHYLDGAIRSGGDTIAVTLALHDVRGDSIVAQETVSGPRAGSRFEALGLQALTLLLPKWLEPGRRVDLSPFTERRLGAIALSIEGDRRYRQSRFAEALAFYRRAVEEDSLLAFAAVKGAQAGTWTDEDQQAAPLVALALAHDSLLPPRHRLYARGLDHYLAGRADSAVARFREALDLDPDWSEARMALGEVYYHLMPSIAGLDTLAERQFRAAQASDTTFSPPMYHLAQLTLRRGEIAEAERHWRRLDRLGADTVLARQLSVMVRCVRDGPRAVDWAAEALRSSTMLWRVGKDLSPGALQVECAKAAFRAVFLSNAPEGHRYTALLGLQGLLLAQGRFGEAAKLLDSALASGFPSVYAIYVMDSFVDTRFVQRAREAERIARAGAGDLYERARPENRLQLAAWLARFGDRERAARVVGALAAAGGSDRAATLGRVLEGHLALAHGDTADALARFRALALAVPRGTLSWTIVEPLAIERILLARLLLDRGEFEAAHAAAAVFDHQEPLAFLPFVPESLHIRARAASGMGRTVLATEYARRLDALGWEQHGPEMSVKADRSPRP